MQASVGQRRPTAAVLYFVILNMASIAGSSGLEDPFRLLHAVKGAITRLTYSLGKDSLQYKIRLYVPAFRLHKSP